MFCFSTKAYCKFSSMGCWSKGCIYGTPICIKGGGGSRTIGIPDPLGTHKRRATARRPRAAKRRGLHPARAAGCDIYATLYPQCNSIPFPAPGPRSGPEEPPAAQRRTTYARACAQPMRVQRRRACDNMSH
jgi:hypothetical protein